MSTLKQLQDRIKELEEGSCRYNCRNAKQMWISGYMCRSGVCTLEDAKNAYNKYRTDNERY